MICAYVTKWDRQYILSISKTQSNNCLCLLSARLDQCVLISRKVQEVYFKSAHKKKITISNDLFNHVTKVMICKDMEIMSLPTTTV